MGTNSRLGPDITMALGDSQATQLNPLPTDFTSSDNPVNMSHSISPLPYHTTLCLLITEVSICICSVFSPQSPGQTSPGLHVVLLVMLSLSWHQEGPCFLLGAQDYPTPDLCGGLLVPLTSSLALWCLSVASTLSKPHVNVERMKMNW